MDITDEVPLVSNRSEVVRKGDIIFRKSGEWTPFVHDILRHLEAKGFHGAPRVVGSGFDDQGREMLTYIEGDWIYPKPWSEDAMMAVALLLKNLHEATSDFRPSSNAIWQPWFSRGLNYSKPIIGHSDLAPWNLISKNGIPFAAIDWETAGPIDRLVEVAQTCWLNVQWFHNDASDGIDPENPDVCAKRLRQFVDVYELPAQERAKLIDAMIRIAVLDASTCKDPPVMTPEIRATVWRLRSAAWMVKHERALNNALV